MKKLILLLSLALSGATLFAQVEDDVVPAFTLTDASGRSTASTELANGGRAIVLFVKPSCRPCEQLLGEMARVVDAGVTPPMVLVVESSADAASTYAAHAVPRQLANVPWFADAAGEAWQALALKGAPVLVGIDGPRIAWTHIGVPQRSLLESLMRTWAGTQGAVR